MFALALLLSCGPDADTGSTYDPCFEAVDAWCACQVARDDSALDVLDHQDCMEYRLPVCADADTLAEIDAVVTDGFCGDD